MAPADHASHQQFGGSVGTAGDVNGDGYADVIVGVYFVRLTFAGRSAVRKVVRIR